MDGLETMKCKLKKGDQVQAVAGKNKGKRGRVLQIDYARNRVIVEGLNMIKKCQRPKSRNDKGGIIEVEGPFSLANVQMLCKKCGITRIGWKLHDKDKTRVCRKCGEVL